MIRLNKVSKIYSGGLTKVNALTDLDLKVEKGEYLALMGASGSGKSTLLNILGLLDRPSKGNYLLDGLEVGGLNDSELSALRCQRFGFVFQQFHLLPGLSSLDNVMLPLVYRKKYPENAQTLGQDLLAQVGLGGKKDSKPGQLSGGQQQRVAIARALINEPAIILADEPTGNLDSASGKEIMDIFDRLHKKGATIIMVTHDPLVANNADRQIKLSDGLIIQDQTRGQL